MRYRRFVLVGSLGVACGVAFGLLASQAIPRQDVIENSAPQGDPSAQLEQEPASSINRPNPKSSQPASTEVALAEPPAATPIPALSAAEVARLYEDSVVVLTTFACGLVGRSSAIVLQSQTLLAPYSGWFRGEPWWATASTPADESRAMQWTPAGAEFAMVTTLVDVGLPLSMSPGELSSSVAVDDRVWLIAALAADGAAVSTVSGRVEAVSADSLTVRLPKEPSASVVGGLVVSRSGVPLGAVSAVESGRGVLVGEIPVVAHASDSGQSECDFDADAVVQRIDGTSVPLGLNEEIASLLRLQYGESLLAHGEYAQAQHVDSFVAQLSDSAMRRGWDVTTASFIAPAGVVSSTSSQITWSLGLVTHETDYTTKRFCVERTVDLSTWMIHRNADRSSQIGGSQSGWLDPHVASGELRARC